MAFIRCVQAAKLTTRGPSENSPAFPDRGLEPLNQLLEALDYASLAELERVMRHALYPAPTAAERHWQELGSLSELLRGRRLVVGWPYMLRDEYDAQRAETAPPARDLSARYGSWSRACYAAHGLRRDGSKTAGGQPWPHPFRGRQRPRRYTREAVLACVRECALVLGRRPSSSDYARWSSAVRVICRSLGIDRRIATINTVYRHFPAAPRRRRWERIIAAAAITDSELLHARASATVGADAALPTGDGRELRVVEGSPVAPLAALDAAARHRIGISDEEWRRIVDERDLGMLSLGTTGRLARELSVSLDWLAGRQEMEGDPPPVDLQFDGPTFQRRRKQHMLREADVARQLLVHPGALRRMQRGTLEPALFQIARMASLVGVSINELCTDATSYRRR